MWSGTIVEVALTSNCGCCAGSTKAAGSWLNIRWTMKKKPVSNVCSTVDKIRDISVNTNITMRHIEAVEINVNEINDKLVWKDWSKAW